MPDIIYSGFAEEIIEEIQDLGKITSVTSGPIGNTALLDKNLENKIKYIDVRFKKWLEKNDFYDYYLNCICSSNLEKAEADCWYINNFVKGSVIGIEPKNKKVLFFEKNRIIERISEKLGFVPQKTRKFNKRFWKKNGKEYRRVLATEKGDYLLINGINIGKVFSDDVLIIKDDKGLDFKGVKVKKDVLNKIKNFSLKDAKIASTNRFRLRKGNKKKYTQNKTKIALINHDAFRIYEIIQKGIKGAVTVGDDTTSISGEILWRFSIPIIGIIDDDRDFLIEKNNFADGSVILVVKSDDLFGKILSNKFFNDSNYLGNRSFADLKTKIIKLAKERDFLIKEKIK